MRLRNLNQKFIEMQGRVHFLGKHWIFQFFYFFLLRHGFDIRGLFIARMYFFPLRYTFSYEIKEFESEVHKSVGKGAFFRIA